MLRRSKEMMQAYQQAPWRRQLQIIGFIAAGLVSVALVAGLYLNITARSATAGRLVQQLQAENTDLQQRIEDLETQLAFITSVETMQERATDMGFAPVSPGAITYLNVPEYTGRPTGAQLAPKAGSQFGAAARLPEQYTTSLFDWLGAIFAGLGGL
jgi:cell division protein FtsB